MSNLSRTPQSKIHSLFLALAFLGFGFLMVGTSGTVLASGSGDPGGVENENISSVAAPIDPNSSCSPSTGQILINTDAAGIDYPTTERTHGHTPWIAGYQGAPGAIAGHQFYLFSVGNNVASFDASTPTSIVRKGTTSTGLTGDVHFPYQLRYDPLISRDDFRYLYLESAQGLWVIDGSTAGNNTVSAQNINSQVSANQGALTKISGGRMLLTVPVSSFGGSGSAATSYLIYDPGTTSIQPNSPNTWPGITSGSPYFVFPDKWGDLFVDSPQKEGLIDPVLDSYIMMNVPYSNSVRFALVDVNNTSNQAFFNVNGIPQIFDQVSFGRVGSMLLAAINDDSNRRFMVFQVDTSQTPINIFNRSSWISWPTTSPAGPAPNLVAMDFAGSSGLLAFGDSNNQGGFLYNVSDPANPAIFPNVADWWYQTYGVPYALSTPWESNPIPGSDMIIVSGDSLAYTLHMPCDTNTTLCDFAITYPSGGKAYPGDNIKFASNVGTPTSVSFNFGDGSPNGTTTPANHSYDGLGSKSVVLTTTNSQGVQCQVTHTAVVTDPSITVALNPPNAVTGVTVVNATQVHDGTPTNGFPFYNWTIWDAGNTNATGVASTAAGGGNGGPTSDHWNFTLGSSATDSQGYRVCVDVTYTATFTKNSCGTNKVHVGNNAANFNVQGTSNATDLILKSTTQGTVNSYCWNLSINGTAQAPLCGNPTGNVIPDAVYLKDNLTPCSPTGSPCYTATLTVGDGTLTNNTPSGDESTAIKNFTMAGSCKQANFKISILGTQFCDSGNTGTASCSSSTSCSGGTATSGDTLQFQPNCAESGTTYVWEFGDGSTSTTQNSTHSYTVTGSSNVTECVKLTVNGTYTDYQAVVVKPASTCNGPVASYSYSASGCNVNFSNTSSNATSYQWNFGDGSNVVSTTSPSHTYAGNGNYTVTLTAFNSCSGNNTNSTSKSVSVTTCGGSCTTPGIPTNISPANGATGVDYTSGVTHSWSTASNANRYNLETYVGAGCSNFLQEYGNLTATSYTVVAGAYSPNTTYSWKVIPFGDSCTTPQGTPSSCFSYTTKSSGTTCTTSTPTAIAPANGAVNVSNVNVNFQWSAVSTSSCTVTYTLTLYSTNCGVTQLAQFGNLTSTSFSVGSVPAGAIFWNVTATVNGTTSSPSNCFVFSAVDNSTCTTPPGAVTTISPANGATNVVPSNLTFSWTAATCTTSYDLSLYNGANCSGTPLQTWGTLPADASPSYTAGSVPANASLSWSITAHGAGGSTASGCTNFSTGPVPTDTPTANYVVKLGGTTQGTNLSTNQSYTFDGTASVPSSGTIITGYAWNFGDGSAAASGGSVSHTFTTAGTFIVTLTVSQSNGKSAGVSKTFTVTCSTCGPIAYLIPAAAHAAGQNNTTWLTDVKIFNPDSQNLTLHMQYRPTGSDNSGAAVVDLPPISPNNTYQLLDIVANAFQVSSGTGAIYITYSSVTKLPVIQSNTYNIPSGSDPSAGTYGQYIPAVPIWASESDPTIYLEGLRISGDPLTGFRTNVGLVNLSTSSTFVNVEIWSELGKKVTANGFTVAPYGQRQLPVDKTKFPELSVPAEGFSGYIKIIPAAGALIKSYLSVVDNSSGDATFIADQHSTGPVVYVAGAASAEGNEGTHWGTSVFFMNPYDTPVTLKVTFIPNGPDGAFNQVNKPVTLAAFGSKIYDDIVGSLFALSGVSGILQVTIYTGTPTNYPIVSARTYNNAATGTFGQSIPAADAEATIGSGGTSSALYLSGLAKNTAFRTNVGFYNQSSTQTATMNFRLIDDSGNIIVEKASETFPPNFGKQYNDFFGTFLGVAGDIPHATLIVTPLNGQGQVSGYASVVDNKTGDPLFIPGNVQ